MSREKAVVFQGFATQTGKRLYSFSYGLWRCLTRDEVRGIAVFEWFGTAFAEPAQKMTPLFLEAFECENQMLSFFVRKPHVTWALNVCRQFLRYDDAIDRSAARALNN